MRMVELNVIPIMHVCAYSTTVLSGSGVSIAVCSISFIRLGSRSKLRCEKLESIMRSVYSTASRWSNSCWKTRARLPESTFCTVSPSSVEYSTDIFVGRETRAA